MIGFLDIDPLSPEGMAMTFVLLAILYLVIVSGGLTVIIGSIIVIAVTFVFYVLFKRFYRWAVGKGGAR